jgi:hypothetical protein
VEEGGRKLQIREAPAMRAHALEGPGLDWLELESAGLDLPGVGLSRLEASWLVDERLAAREWAAQERQQLESVEKRPAWAEVLEREVGLASGREEQRPAP